MDCANSGYEIAQAVNSQGKHNVRVITCVPHPFNYPRDIETCGKPIDKKKVEMAKNLIYNADIIHCKGDHIPEEIWARFNNHLGGLDKTIFYSKPIITSVAGNYFRRAKQCKDPSCPAHSKVFSFQRHPFKKYIESTALRTALTPDLNYPEYQGTYTQQTINAEKQKNIWQPSSPPLIVHSPSIRRNKGTDSVFLPALKLLSKKHKFQLDIIENVSSKEVIERKKKATIFFDQCSIGAYGVSLLEATQFGIPSLAWISHHSIEQSEGKIGYDIPVGFFTPTPQELCNKLDIMLRSNLEELSIRTKKWTENFHGYNTVATMWDKLYCDVVEKN